MHTLPLLTPPLGCFLPLPNRNLTHVPHNPQPTLLVFTDMLNGKNKYDPSKDD
jgi:hypothetical protein